MACHNNLTAPSGESRSIGIDWRSSMMANAARDPYWQASVRRETLDHPNAGADIADECSKCHMPMARFEAQNAGAKGEIFTHLPIGAAVTRQATIAADGVSCGVCHQITAKDLGQRKSFVGGFDIDAASPPGRRSVFGPFQIDRGRTRVMRSTAGFQPRQSTHLKRSEVCATCHTLITHALDADGRAVGELPEQVPYLEWLHSDYRQSASCQSCHMPEEEQPMNISSVLGQPRQRLSRHQFRGGNFFMMNILGRYSAQLGVQALPLELTATSTATRSHLDRSAATVALSSEATRDGRIEVVVRIDNNTGHKLPTAYPSRRAWIHFIVRDSLGETVFESGRLNADGTIAGNDNDTDPQRYEPHYDRIDSSEQVQIFEPILGGPDGGVTTGLLTASQYLKDNRVLPRGFDKSSAAEEIKVRGRAAGDDSFIGGSDELRYSVAVAGHHGPFTVSVALRYQPVGYRWAHNLGTQTSAETDRFVRMYRAMSGSSAATLAQAQVIITEREAH